MDKDTLKEKLDFLAKDEEEAIAGYDKVIDELDDDSPIKAQLKKIRDEEQAHLDFLNKAKEDENAKYEDPSDSDSDEEEDEEKNRKAALELFGLKD